METWEAMKLLQEGKKIRRQAWARGEYIHLINGVLLDEKNRDFDANYIKEMFFNSVSPWEEYKEGSQSWQNPHQVGQVMCWSYTCPYCEGTIIIPSVSKEYAYCLHCGKKVIK